ncbi:MAG TPA: elongation factor P [Candidatus Sumerlaeota bacterium]|nr:MAG: Elongation factor P [candidate division BRC1 bacterium ADurb.BinA292]HOE95463.1 elongation factor P [Candidatus Sumerlaeota bacterium]HOR28789.1 elongation factor P [Candidatus Sumerlaeota bacterium]
MVAIDANDARPGTKLLIDGELYNVVERAHHKPGKGGAFVKFKLKGLRTGKVIDQTVRAGTILEQADIINQTMQYVYQENDQFIFMDLQTYEQMPVPASVVGDAAQYLIENTDVQVTLYEGQVIGLQLPPKMDFTVIETIDDAVRGNTATNVTKDAKIETGLIVQVPMFVKTGEKIRISTEDGKYIERA